MTLAILLMIVAQAGTADLQRENKILRLENERLTEEVERLEQKVAELTGRVSRDPLYREWTKKDGTSFTGLFVDFAQGKATFKDKEGESITISTAELDASCRSTIQAEVKSRREIEDKLKGGSFMRCPNHDCIRGKIYGTSSGSIASPTGSLTFHGKVPTGSCPVCGGRGVVAKR